MEITAAQSNEIVVIETKFGLIIVKLFVDKASGHVKNFKDLVQKGFYNGTTFHQVIPSFMIHGGDLNTKSNDRSNN
jgi:peptidyl-prolyl cis-trans isomerase B (cyclophilin B)